MTRIKGIEVKFVFSAVIFGVMSLVSLVLLTYDSSVFHDEIYRAVPYATNLQNGFDTLQANSELWYGQRGFNEIRDIVSQKLLIDNPEAIQKIRLVKTNTSAAMCLNGYFASNGLELHLTDFSGKDYPISLCDFQPPKLSDYVYDAVTGARQGLVKNVGVVLAIPGLFGSGAVTVSIVKGRKKETSPEQTQG